MQIATLIVHVNRYINSTCKSFHWLTVHVNHYTSNTCKLLCRILSSHILTKKVCRNSKTFQKTDMNILCEGNVDLSQYFTDWLTMLIFHPIKHLLYLVTSNVNWTLTSDYAHDQGVRDGRLDVKGLLIQGLKVATMNNINKFHPLLYMNIQ